ncbi:MAG: energy transducer TonB [Burkholderiales bacterium]
MKCSPALLLLAALLAPNAMAQPQPEAPPAKPTPPRQLQIYQRVMPQYSNVGPDGGCVTVKFEIRHDGIVGEVEVLEAKPKELAAPTVAAMKQWVFQSYPPTDAKVHASQTFHYTPETIRLPDNAIRGPFATLGEGGAVASAGCGTPAKPAVTAPPAAKKPAAKQGKTR